MARNEEKQISELNRFVFAKERDQGTDAGRPPLSQLHTAEAIRRWIPDIKREIRYCVQQIEGSRNYSEAKILEFRLRIEELQKEHKRFVAKALQLDPNPMWKPGERHAYVSKKSFEEARRSREGESSSHIAPSSTRESIPSGAFYVDLSEVIEEMERLALDSGSDFASDEELQHLNTQECRRGGGLVQNIGGMEMAVSTENGNSRTSENLIDGYTNDNDNDNDDDDDDDIEIDTPLARQENVGMADPSSRAAQGNTQPLNRGYNSLCHRYYTPYPRP